MEVMYKKTDVGSIPADWDVRTLSELFDKGFQNGVFYEVDRKGKGVPIVNVSDLYGSVPIKEHSLEKFDATADEIDRFLVCKGDLFFTRSSIVPSGIAMCNVYDGEIEHNAVFDSHVIKLSVNQHEINPLFLCLQCRMPYIRRFFIANSKTATMTTIDQKAMTGCPIPMPSLPEQERIVETLQSFDTYIDNLAELIEKKRNIRDGALEDLVSGKTRLKGFNDEWSVRRIGNCADIYQGGTPKTTNLHFWNGDVVWVTPGEITKNKSLYIHASERMITTDGVNNSSATILPKGTILLCTRATIGYLAIADIELATNQGFKNLVCKPDIDNVFFAYALMTKKTEMLSKAIGTTFLEISKKALSGIEMRIPSFSEQQAISAVLIAMDEEIEALENERNKIIQIREGAKDDLLTGRVQLKV